MNYNVRVRSKRISFSIFDSVRFVLFFFRFFFYLNNSIRCCRGDRHDRERVKIKFFLARSRMLTLRVNLSVRKRYCQRVRNSVMVEQKKDRPLLKYIYIRSAYSKMVFLSSFWFFDKKKKNKPQIGQSQTVARYWVPTRT